jgi:hypothetical protein
MKVRLMRVQHIQSGEVLCIGFLYLSLHLIALGKTWPLIDSPSKRGSAD